MKIAFTSCIDTVNDPIQNGWTELAKHDPDAIVLLGDTIYMDYGLGNHQPNGSPKGEPLDRFSHLMHEAYAAQWGVKNFRDAIQGRKVYAIWDDHDFAWNNARGAGGAQSKDFVPSAYRRLSRLHFERFREALAEHPDSYGPNPAPSGIVSEDLGSIEQTVDVAEGIRLHLIDPRSFREDEGASLLGESQRSRLQDALLAEPGVNLIASSGTVKDWKEYDPDYAWLKDMARRHNILMLCGDVHEPDFRERGRLFEATASAMAQPPGITAIFGKKTEVYGLLTTGPDKLHVELFSGKKRVEDHLISRVDWSV
jgi:alkaline phosphatase D